MTRKQLLARALLFSEILIFGWYYWYGARMLTIRTLQHDIAELEIQKSDLIKKVEELRVLIQSSSSWDLHQERIAREELQMAYPEDKIIVY